ncbi:TPA: molecular chaperone [Enterobacter chengduensis]|nr:molecular chaperone [Enterobacter chengduensis]
MKKALIAAALISAVWGNTALAGVVTSSTRAIVNGEKKEAIISLGNPDKSSWKIDAWVDADGANSGLKLPLSVTPSSFRLDAGSRQLLKIAFMDNGQPTDRESLFRLNVKSTPDFPAEKSQSLMMSVNQRLKVFYRPAGIKAPSESDYKKLSFHRQGKNLSVNNPTPYYMTFYSLTLGGMAVNTNGKMVPPKGKVNYLMPEGYLNNTLTWRVINDYGGESAAHVMKLY